MKDVQVHNRSRPLASPLHAGYCAQFGCKLRGLSWRAKLAQGRGLILAEAAESRMGTSVHMLGMFFDLAIVWLDKDLEVVDLRAARRWRSFLRPRKPAQYVIEFGLDRLEEFAIGDQIEFETQPLD